MDGIEELMLIANLHLNDTALPNRPRFDPIITLEIERSGNTEGHPLNPGNLREFLGDYHFDERHLEDTTSTIRRFNPEADNNYIGAVVTQLMHLLRNTTASKENYRLLIEQETERIQYLIRVLRDILLRRRGASVSKPFLPFGRNSLNHLSPTVPLRGAITKEGTKKHSLNSEELWNIIRGGSKLWIYVNEEIFFCEVVTVEDPPQDQIYEDEIQDNEGFHELEEVYQQLIRLQSSYTTSKKNENRDYQLYHNRIRKGLRDLASQNNINLGNFLI